MFARTTRTQSYPLELYISVYLPPGTQHIERKACARFETYEIGLELLYGLWAENMCVA